MSLQIRTKAVVPLVSEIRGQPVSFASRISLTATAFIFRIGQKLMEMPIHSMDLHLPVLIRMLRKEMDVIYKSELTLL